MEYAIPSKFTMQIKIPYRQKYMHHSIMRSLPENPNIIVEVSQLRHVAPGSTKNGYFRCFLPRQETLSEQGYAKDDRLFRRLLWFDFSPESTKPVSAESKIDITGLNKLYRKNKDLSISKLTSRLKLSSTTSPLNLQFHHIKLQFLHQNSFQHYPSQYKK